MIALYIVATLLILITLILFLPVSVDLKFQEEFTFKIKLFGIKVFAPSKKVSKKFDKDVENEPLKEENKIKGLFSKLKDKKGFIGAVKEVFELLKDCLKQLEIFLKTIKFKKVCLDLSVAGDDAAKTAIQYGQVCAIVYPTLAFLQTKANVKYKNINVKSEFENKQSEFSFSLTVNLQILFLLITVFKVYKEYKNFITRNGLQ